MSYFPIDATTQYFPFGANGTTTLLSASDRTILQSVVVGNQSSGNKISISCGSDVFFDNRKNDSVMLPMQKFCNQAISINVTSFGVGGEVILTTVPRDIASSTETVAISAVSSAATTTLMYQQTNIFALCFEVFLLSFICFVLVWKR